MAFYFLINPITMKKEWYGLFFLFFPLLIFAQDTIRLDPLQIKSEDSFLPKYQGVFRMELLQQISGDSLYHQYQEALQENLDYVYSGDYDEDEGMAYLELYYATTPDLCAVDFSDAPIEGLKKKIELECAIFNGMKALREKYPDFKTISPGEIRKLNALYQEKFEIENLPPFLRKH